MRILLIAPGMIDTHTRRFIQMLVGAGYSVTCLARETPFVGDEQFTFIKYPEVYIPKWIWPQKFRQALKEWGLALRLRYVWRQVKPDLIHVLYINLHAYHCALARLHPLVLTALGSDINNLFQVDAQEFENRKKIARALLAADHITADTREVLKRCDILAERSLHSSLFYFGIDLNLFRPRSMEEESALRRKLGISPISKVILSPRRIIPQMRHELVLKAFFEFKKKNNGDALLIYRRFGHLSALFEVALQKLAEDLEIGDQIIWVDEMDYSQIPILYSLADLVINIPEVDGLPVTLFEASACMTPVITSDLSAYQEFLSDGAYYRVNGNDTNGIVDLMQKILSASNKDLAENLRKNYDLVIDKASQEKCFSLVEKIYQELLS